LKTGVCPKCQSTEIYSGSDIPLKKGPFGSNAIPVSMTSIAALDNYVCVDCGYVESYIGDREKLKEIHRKWVRVAEPAPSDPHGAV
jgi:predicted nucleic-acid-binding Zn-ribbon protein